MALSARKLRKLNDHGKQITVCDCGGCTCTDFHLQIDDNCLYHLAAALQPWNHRIPWNCPSYYDGCNCVAYPITAGQCIERGRHLKSCDSDGYCNYCGHQDSPEFFDEG